MVSTPSPPDPFTGLHKGSVLAAAQRAQGGHSSNLAIMWLFLGTAAAVFIAGTVFIWIAIASHNEKQRELNDFCERNPQHERCQPVAQRRPARSGGDFATGFLLGGMAMRALK